MVSPQLILSFIPQRLNILFFPYLKIVQGNISQKFKLLFYFLFSEIFYVFQQKVISDTDG